MSPAWQRERVNSKWRWVWNGWVSQAFDELEERPWTPLAMGDRLCFSAYEDGKWFVVFGDDCSPPFDDAFDTEEHKGQPLFVARNRDEWFIVWGKLRSRGFPMQISFEVVDDVVYASWFSARGTDNPVEVLTFRPYESEIRPG
jgi:hypothetical protein